MRLAATELQPRDAWTLVSDGFPVVLDLGDENWLLLKYKTAWRIEALQLSAGNQKNRIPRPSDQLATTEELLGRQAAPGSLDCAGHHFTRDSSSPVNDNSDVEAHTHGAHHAGHGGGGHDPHHHHHDHHQHLPPLKRLWRLLRLEVRDIWTLTLFALVAGVLGLATPLAVESLVNTVAWGTYLQPLFVLSAILFGFWRVRGSAEAVATNYCRNHPAENVRSHRR